jgi:hypothetical protein
MKNLPRGYRNNNPLNIRKSPQEYRGEITGEDKSFKTFSTMGYGFRAAFVIMRTYMRKYKLDTVEKIINRWAPPSENDTAGYIRFVCTHSGRKPTEVIYFTPEDLIPIVLAMAHQENGLPCERIYAEEGWELI